MLSGLTDLADGYIARRFHMISNLGKILDPVADKLTQAAMLICSFTRFPHMLPLIVIMAVKELYMAVSDTKNRKSAWCRLAWKDSNLFIIWNCGCAYYMVPHYTNGVRSVNWFVCYNDGCISCFVHYQEYQNT